MTIHSAPHETGGARPRVLVVNSNRKYLGVTARRLGELGYRVVTAETAHTAMAEIHRSPVELVLSEARLKGASGIELVRMVRDDTAHADIPLLLIVGRSDSALAVRAFESGADGVVRKPCHFELLAACIARQLDRARAVRQLIAANIALDARLVNRAIELGEMRARCEIAETERRRLENMLDRSVA